MNPLMIDITLLLRVLSYAALYIGKAIANGSYGNSITNLQAVFLFTLGLSKFSMITVLT